MPVSLIGQPASAMRQEPLTKRKKRLAGVRTRGYALRVTYKASFLATSRVRSKPHGG